MPRVISPSSKIVFCEGRPGSLDDLFLAKLAGAHVLIKPVGGKHGMRAFIDGYLGSYPDTRPDYLGFRDRDFDIVPPDIPKLIRLQGEKPIWLCYRAAIENYMIDADLIWEYWKARENTPRWQHGPALPTSEIEDHIRDSARELADYQAVRWALSSLKPGARWPEISTTWTDGSGRPPPSLAFDDCLNQACSLVSSFETDISAIAPSRLQKNAETYRLRFQEDSFLQEQGYLVWFHGKDHLAQLCAHLAPNFPRRHYQDWAAEHIEIDKHPDLQQLAKMLR